MTTCGFSVVFNYILSIGQSLWYFTMLKSEIQPGMVVLCGGEAAEVVRCLPISRVELVISRDRRTIQVDIGDILLLPETQADGRVKLDQEIWQRMENASLAEAKIAEERFLVFELYHDGKIDIAEAATRVGVSLSRAYQLLKNYDAELGIACFLRRTRGRQRGAFQLTEKVEVLVKKVISRKPGQHRETYASLYSKVKSECIESSLPTPSRGAVVARIKTLSLRESYALQHGAEAAAQRYGAKPGKRLTSRPLEWVQMDHTQVDIILCDHSTRETIGRPWLTVIVDVHTRVILGYYIGFNSPSAVSVATALCLAVVPKKSYMQAIGLDSSAWPFYGVPEMLHMDNAKEFISSKFRRACLLHGIKTEYRPLGRKHYGGHVERLIGTLMTSKVHFLPGTTFSNTRRRKGYDSQKRAALSLNEFYRWFALEVERYHISTHRELKMSPMERWDQSYRAQDIVRHPPLLVDPLRFRLDFLPEVRRVITPRGIAFSNMYYWSPGLAMHIGKRNILVKYDPLSLSRIWVKLDVGYLEVGYSDVTLCDATLEESRSVNRLATVSAPELTEKQQRLRKQSSDVIVDGVRRTKKARKEQATRKEYSEHLQNIGGQTLKQEVSQDVTKSSPDYSIKPTPLSSEDA